MECGFYGEGEILSLFKKQSRDAQKVFLVSTIHLGLLLYKYIRILDSSAWYDEVLLCKTMLLIHHLGLAVYVTCHVIYPLSGNRNEHLVGEFTY